MNETTVLITGAANGIGWATAQLFAGRGCRVAIVDLDGGMATARAEELGSDHLGVQCDVTVEASVREACAKVLDRFNHCSILVNNAGIGDMTVPTLEQDASRFMTILNTHLTGSFLISREIARRMIADNGGAIVNFSSIAAHSGLPGRNAYGAAKAGLIAMTKSMACEWAGHGVRVNAVAPGYVETELVGKLVAGGLLDKERILRRTPMGRMIAPSEIAEAVWFLASPAASAITGAVLNVDAGWQAYGAAGDAFHPKAI
ncbi:SDR family oxidoreductase [Labrenzia aggregata]|uniref:SDR family oxidoreductase n=1 Tax=Roseibium aggregatum TaxID=187304 RepID=A0A926P396_9HYPH|nr:SDR family oxidoreductase [Roseibium aggregatum]